MASILTIILFFAYFWGLGFAATYFIKKKEGFWEQQFLNLGLGMGLFPILSIALNFLRIPLDWKIFLGISLAVPIYAFYQRMKSSEAKVTLPEFRLTKSNLVLLLVLGIALVSFYIYAKGAFSYPYLEDEDPWGHSVGAKYVALEKNAYDPKLFGARTEMDSVLSYIDPYPPAYDVLMGVLHQTSPDLNWTIKFFNALIISLGFVFFYLFARNFMNSRSKALFSTFVLASIPGYLSHFIWAHALVLTIFFPTLYAFERLREENCGRKGNQDAEEKESRKDGWGWMAMALLLVASIWVTQNLEQPIKLSTMLLIYIIIVSVICRRWFWQGAAALAGGGALSLLWWGVIVQKYSLQGFLKYYTGSGTEAAAEGSAALAPAAGKLWSMLGSLTSPGGTASRAYTFSDFFFAQGENMINNPVGIGMVVSIVTVLGVFYLLWRYRSSLVQEENLWKVIALFWLIFAFWGVNGMTFPISVAKGAFRVWMLLAVTAALVCSEGLVLLQAFAKSKLLRSLIVAAVVVGIILTSAQQKFQLNTSIWPTSGSFSGMPPSAPFDYGAWFETLSPDTKVFLLSPRDKVAIGFGAFSCDWCQEVLDFRKDILSHDAQEFHQFLKTNQYEYLVLSGPMDFRYLSQQYGNETEKLLYGKYQEILSSGRFTPTYQKENLFVALRVN